MQKVIYVKTVLGETKPEATVYTIKSPTPIKMSCLTLLEIQKSPFASALSASSCV